MIVLFKYFNRIKEAISSVQIKNRKVISYRKKYTYIYVIFRDNSCLLKPKHRQDLNGCRDINLI